MIKTLLVLVLFSLVLPDDNVEYSKKNKEKKHYNILADDNPELQSTINKLEDDYNKKRRQIREKYKIKFQNIKKQKNQELEIINKQFVDKLDKLQKQYPRMILKTVPIDNKNAPKHINKAKRYRSNEKVKNKPYNSVNKKNKMEKKSSEK
tara:strand:- start:93 stop:542 length:450 start_codon:yes stop_codon:yes gene_type:complete